jgi:hypothetical protein
VLKKTTLRGQGPIIGFGFTTHSRQLEKASVYIQRRQNKREVRQVMGILADGKGWGGTVANSDRKAISLGLV